MPLPRRAPRADPPLDPAPSWQFIAGLSLARVGIVRKLESGSNLPGPARGLSPAASRVGRTLSVSTQCGWEGLPLSGLDRGVEEGRPAVSLLPSAGRSPPRQQPCRP